MPKSNNPEKKRTLRRRVAIAGRLLRSSRGKDILIFLLFLCISYAFWVIMSLNDDTQRDLAVKLEISGTPENTTFISEVPQALQVSVRDKGSVLANYLWTGTPTLKIPYKDFTYDGVKDRVVLGELALDAKVRSLFGSSTQVVAVRPDSLSLIITDRPPSMARVIPRIEATPSSQCVISGPITVTPDSVKVFSARHLPVKARKVNTVKVIRSELKDTLVLEVRLQPESGIRMVPDRVTVTVPVEPLISKTREVPVTLVHAADPSSIVLFPSRVKITYLLPMSLYNSENGVVSVTADFRQRSHTRIPLSVGALPEYYRGVSLNTDSVEYLIEQKTSLHNPASNNP